jgi:hypothetical protein
MASLVDAQVHKGLVCVHLQKEVGRESSSAGARAERRKRGAIRADFSTLSNNELNPLLLRHSYSSFEAIASPLSPSYHKDTQKSTFL